MPNNKRYPQTRQANSPDLVIPIKINDHGSGDKRNARFSIVGYLMWPHVHFYLNETYAYAADKSSIGTAFSLVAATSYMLIHV